MKDGEPTVRDGAEFRRVFARIGLQSFGGPAAQIALMHRVLVEETGWLSEQRFLKALSFCMLLPGPEAMQLATYAGWRLRGVRGGLTAGLLFVLPGAAVIFALATLYVLYGRVPWVSAAFLGVKAAVLAIVAQAAVRLFGRALKERWHWALALTAFAALFVLDLPFPLVIGAAALVGWLSARGRGATPARPAKVTAGHTARVLALGTMIWFAPLLIVVTIADAPVVAEVARFFSMLAIVTFGGAYAVLSWMAQAAVNDLGWLDAGAMLDALGLAETTPGPLILVTQFVAFLAGAGAPDGQGGLALAFLCGAVALWATFVPCFVWIFAGAPWIETLTSRPGPAGALAGIQAAVVGVIASLSVWFALHVFFDTVSRGNGWLAVWWPRLDTIRPDAILLALGAAIMLFVLRWSMGRVLVASAAAALALSVFALPVISLSAI